MPLYPIRPLPAEPALDGDWSDPLWKPIPAAPVNRFHPDSPNRHPRTRVKLASGPRGLHLFFRVEDRQVIARCTRYQEQVCKDSCVEFFVEPDGNRGYFNFEFNCTGVLLLYHITDSTRTPGGFRGRRAIPLALGRQVKTHASFAGPILKAIPGPLVWHLQAFIPFRLFESCLGPIQPLAGKTWRGNFYKCGSDQRHYASWAPIGTLNFHQPCHFAPLVFENP